MRKFIYLFIFFSIVFYSQNIFAQSYNGWFFVNPKPFANSFYSCDFLDANTGYALCGNGMIVKTSNSGLNWTVHSYINTITIQAKKLYIQDANTFYIIGTNGKILKSTNTGLTFFAQSLPIGAPLNDIIFINNNTGILAADQYLLRTTNAGNNWTNIMPSFFANYYSIIFQNEQTGLITANGGRILKTTNGGLNWITIQTPATNNLNSITFLNANTGFACGNLGAIVRTTNGGNNWIISNSPFNADYKTVNFLNATSGFILCYKDEENHLIMTSNGGLSWEYDDFWSFGPYQMHTWTVLQPNQALLLGDYGQIYKSSTLTSWSNISSISNTNNINEMEFFNENTGYAIDDTARVFRTSDGGNTWSQLSHTTGLNYTGIAFADINTGVLYGADVKDPNYIFRIYRTTNAAQSWSQVYLSPPEQVISKIDFPNSSTGYMMGGDGVYRTTNSGLNWLLISTQVTYTEKMEFVNVNTGFTIPWSGDTVFKTTNGGFNWFGIKGISDTSQIGIFDFDFFDSNTGVVTLGDDGRVKYLLKTTNGGTSWDSIALVDTLSYFSDAKFLSLNKGFINTFGGLYTTTNGGTNWYFNPFISAVFAGPHITQSAGNLIFINNNTGFLYGHNGYLAKTTTGGSVFINNENQNIPTSHMLFQNYPNPFNPSTTISFYLKKAGLIKLNVYDISGRQVAELINENRPSGFNQVAFNAENLSSGVYFYQLETDDFKESKKMVLIK